MHRGVQPISYLEACTLCSPTSAVIVSSFVVGWGLKDSDGSGLTAAEVLVSDKFDAFVGGGSPVATVPAKIIEAPATGAIDPDAVRENRRIVGLDAVSEHVDGAHVQITRPVVVSETQRIKSPLRPAVVR